MEPSDSAELQECEPGAHAGSSARVQRVDLARVEQASRLFRALGDGPRLRLLAHLLTGGKCVGDLAQLESESLSTISQRLRVLHTENVVKRRRLGKHVNYELADHHIAELVANALAHASERL